MHRALCWISNYRERCAEAYALLRENGVEVLSVSELGEAETERLIPEMDFAIAGMNRWDAAMFQKAAKLRLLTKFGSGVDNIDLAAARRHGVDVCNTKGENANAVAELVVAQMIAMLRYLPETNRELHEGKWVKRTGRELRGKTLGLVGFGMIARRLAALLQPFEMNFLAFDPYPNEEEAQRLGVEFVTLDQLLQESDLISLHAPGTPENTHMIGEAELGRMKQGALFVNCARAGLVDGSALERALRSGAVAAAALDAFEQEPADPDDPLTRLPNTVCSAHYGGSTLESVLADSMTSAHIILEVLEGKVPHNLLNAEVSEL